MVILSKKDWEELFYGTPYNVRDVIRKYLETTPLEILKRTHFEAKHGFILRECHWTHEDAMSIVIPYVTKLQIRENKLSQLESKRTRLIAYAALLVSFLGLFT